MCVCTQADHAGLHVHKLIINCARRAQQVGAAAERLTGTRRMHLKQTPPAHQSRTATGAAPAARAPQPGPPAPGPAAAARPVLRCRLHSRSNTLKAMLTARSAGAGKGAGRTRISLCASGRNSCREAHQLHAPCAGCRRRGPLLRAAPGQARGRLQALAGRAARP